MWLKSWPWKLKTNKVIDKEPKFYYVRMLLSASNWNSINQNKSMSLHTVARPTNESYVTSDSTEQLSRQLVGDWELRVQFANKMAFLFFDNQSWILQNVFKLILVWHSRTIRTYCVKEKERVKTVDWAWLTCSGVLALYTMLENRPFYLKKHCRPLQDWRLNLTNDL